MGDFDPKQSCQEFCGLRLLVRSAIGSGQPEDDGFDDDRPYRVGEEDADNGPGRAEVG